MTAERRRPTEGELEILRVLWRRGPCTVRDVHEAVGQSRKVGYTTVLKMMQIMHERGMVKRRLEGRTHVYAPAVSEERTLRHLVRHVVERAFGGSARKLVIHALQAEPVSQSELREIAELIDKLRGGKQ